ncbi:MAG TPA: tetratricopeptide repeat protein [Kiritimatiellia bacterium]|nr:tetratricopeptide repeat protein [Kiritimatiellia bacterium]
MKESRNIYEKPEAPKQQEPLPRYEHSLDELWQRTRRNVIVVVVIVVGLLAVAGIFFLIDESRHHVDVDELPVTEVARRPAAPRPVAEPARFPQMDFSLDETRPDEAPHLAPQKMAEAMGYLRIGQQFLRAREFDRAEEEVLKALEIWPDMNAGLRMLGAIYTQRGQFDQAILLLERSMRKDPFSPETLNNLAINFMQKNMMQRAEELLLTSMQIRPDYSVANLNLALLYLRWGRYALAAEHYEVAQRSLPDNSSLLNNLAVCYIRLGEFDDARQQLGRLIALDDGHAAAFFNYAITYTLEGRVEEALEWIRKGARRCTPTQLYTFLSDTDFDPIRTHPGFREFLEGAFPEAPAFVRPPGS